MCVCANLWENCKSAKVYFLLLFNFDQLISQKKKKVKIEVVSSLLITYDQSNIFSKNFFANRSCFLQYNLVYFKNVLAVFPFPWLYNQNKKKKNLWKPLCGKNIMFIFGYAKMQFSQRSAHI